jgi:adenosylcobyric acid synthase
VKSTSVAKALMIVGTGSGAGKSLIVAALCRIFRDDGVHVAPFKAQNMALNSCITVEGGEIGRAQVLQAEAARTPPINDMNPVLLKASGDMGSQVIIHGRPVRHMKAQEYYAFRETAWQAVKESYHRLSRAYDLIVMEGAGSPAEINLMDVDIVNMAAAKLAKAPALLVGDIDKGGVFASLYGTVKLLGKDGRHIRAFIINKFRGDIEILKPGLDLIKKKTGKPVIGVLPYVTDIGLPEEDGLSLKSGTSSMGDGTVRVVVVRLKYISNFTDFDPFFCEPDVHLLYSTNPSDIENADMVIVPGSKNTVKDLLYLRESGLDKSILKASDRGNEVVGICGGYQMCGKTIRDPKSVESEYREVDGLGLLDIETVFDETKITCLVEAEIARGSLFDKQDGSDRPLLKGYEIHMGESTSTSSLFRVTRLSDREKAAPDATESTHFDGSSRGNSWGTYLHGIFDNDVFRRNTINRLRASKGLSPLDSAVSYVETRNEALDRLAAMVKKNIDMAFIRRLLAL